MSDLKFINFKNKNKIYRETWGNNLVIISLRTHYYLES